jgi:hypothetical protein
MRSKSTKEIQRDKNKNKMTELIRSPVEPVPPDAGFEPEEAFSIIQISGRVQRA